jgi:N6-adenosine-specific RNA methylase IME4
MNVATPYQVMPDLGADEFAALKADISERGVLIPVEYDEDGNILDGHHRVRACQELGLADWPRFIRKGLSEDEKRTHALVLNLTRRHLTKEQRTPLWAEMRAAGMSYRQIAEADGTVSKSTVADALSTVQNRTVAQPEHVTGKDGKRRAPTKPKTTYVDPTPEGEKEALSTAKAIRAKKASEQREKRLENIANIAKGNEELSISVRYPVIYADPPWRYENPPIGATSRAIENHYPTMTLEEICALPVRELATDDAILYLWATAPKLAECLDVISAWGFNYRTNMVWDKEKIGMGYHVRNQHELLLICTRGQIPPPAPGTQPSSVYREARGEHSAKPAFFAEMIERNYPGLPKIELFCRSPRDGWAVWGNQSGAAA